ncbi:hypothetical protein SEUCBS139899_009891 [Sporothrix eucalyptigena]
MAFLDIAPLSEGHLLLCPRMHREKLTSLDDLEAAELGRWLRILSKALMRAIGIDDWNIVQNNGAAAAQVISGDKGGGARDSPCLGAANEQIWTSKREHSLRKKSELVWQGFCVKIR